MDSSRPGKQRSAVAEATLNKRREMVAAHLSKELRSQYKRRSMSIRKGDEVKIVTGEYAGKTGQVSAVNTRDFTILIDGVMVKRTIGTEKQVPIRPSKVVITSLNLDDNSRQRILLRKVKEVKVEKKEPKPAETKAEIKTEEKAEVKVDEKKVEKEEKQNEIKKDERAEVLASRKKGDKVGSGAKARSAQKA